MNKSQRAIAIVKGNLDTLRPRWVRVAGHLLSETLSGDNPTGVMSHTVRIEGVWTSVILYLNPDTLAVSVEKGTEVLATIDPDTVMAAADTVYVPEEEDAA